MRPIFKKPEPGCPICGAKMRLKEPKPGQSYYEPFWGCPNYPDCKGTRDIGDDGRPILDDEPAVEVNK